MAVQPCRITVIGTGVIEMELGQAMERLRTKVTMFGRSGTVLPKEDADLAEAVKAQFLKNGVKLSLNVAKCKKQHVRV